MFKRILSIDWDFFFCTPLGGCKGCRFSECGSHNAGTPLQGRNKGFGIGSLYSARLITFGDEFTEGIRLLDQFAKFVRENMRALMNAPILVMNCHAEILDFVSREESEVVNLDHHFDVEPKDWGWKKNNRDHLLDVEAENCGSENIDDIHCGNWATEINNYAHVRPEDGEEYFKEPSDPFDMIVFIHSPPYTTETLDGLLWETIACVSKTLTTKVVPWGRGHRYLMTALAKTVDPHRLIHPDVYCQEDLKEIADSTNRKSATA